ncbi:unnamed protein product, partial [marine sediment metagenome]
MPVRVSYSSITISPTLIVIIIIPEIGMTYIQFTFPQDLVEIMAIKAKRKVIRHVKRTGAA